jgi:hypothetical protein
VAKLKCSNCGKVFDKDAVVEHGSVGVTGAGVGIRYSLPIWPLTLRIYAKSPICKKPVWLKVLPPWSRS